MHGGAMSNVWGRWRGGSDGAAADEVPLLLQGLGSGHLGSSDLSTPAPRTRDGQREDNHTDEKHKLPPNPSHGLLSLKGAALFVHPHKQSYAC